jgi:4-hydroxy-tetrahydrodipicolinate synthase
MGEMGKPILAGVLPVFQTPYRDDETIDYDVLRRELDWLLDQGADGVVMAMVSEVLRLAEAERRELAEAVCQHVAGRGTVVISAGAESARVAEAYARHAESAGATAVMAIPPVSVALDEAELLGYFRRIVRAVGIPVIVQDASGYVGRPIPLAACRRLLDEFGPERICFKPEATPISPRLSVLRDETRGRARVFEGTGGIALVDSHRRGIVGTMPGADLIDGIVALWRALEAKENERARVVHAALCPLLALQNSLDSFLAIEKYLLHKRGIFRNTMVRGPVGYLMDEETRREVDVLFDRLQAVLAG